MTLSVATSNAEMERLSASRDGWKPLQVTICGGGNGAHVAAGFLASRGIRFVSRLERGGLGLSKTCRAYCSSAYVYWSTPEFNSQHLWWDAAGCSVS